MVTTTKTTSGRDDAPPPPYSAIPSIDSTDASVELGQSTSTGPPLNEAPTIAGAAAFPQQQHNRAYGPTPIPQQLQQGILLPYYDPRSPYAVQQAVSRARWRFAGALVWAIGIWVAFGILTGGIVIDIRRAR